LVLDDTPGAFLVGVLMGTKSLLVNVTDVSLTTMVNVNRLVSWFLIGCCLDKEFRILKNGIHRKHPTGVIDGVWQGMKELGRNFWSGFSGIAVLPYRIGKRQGALGVMKGIGQGLLGLPLKPVSGVFDFFSKTFEGVLQSLGRGYLIQTRLHPIVRRESFLSAYFMFTAKRYAFSTRTKIGRGLVTNGRRRVS